MPVIVVANPKGGVGKSTLATNLAGWFARQGHATMLGDTDRQQSSRRWLGLRPEGRRRSAAGTNSMAATSCVRRRADACRARSRRPVWTASASNELMKIADKFVVPPQPSLFDIQATHDFIGELQAIAAATSCRSASSACVCAITRSSTSS